MIYLTVLNLWSKQKMKIVAVKRGKLQYFCTPSNYISIFFLHSFVFVLCKCFDKNRKKKKIEKI